MQSVLSDLLFRCRILNRTLLFRQFTKRFRFLTRLFLRVGPTQVCEISGLERDNRFDGIIRKSALHIRYTVFKNEAERVAQALSRLINRFSLAVCSWNLRTNRPESALRSFLNDCSEFAFHSQTLLFLIRTVNVS